MPIYMTGETEDTSIKALRTRQMKNFHLALMTSQVQHFQNLYPNIFFTARLFIDLYVFHHFFNAFFNRVRLSR